MKQIYNDGTYLNANSTWHEEDSPWKVQQIIRLFERNSLSPSTVCEVGCGSGGILNLLSDYYENIEFRGFEISTHAYSLCQSRTKVNLSFELGDIFSVGQRHFDVAMAIDVFEHVENYLGFVRTLKELAEYKVYHIPLDLNLLTVLMPSRIRLRRERFGHLHYFTKETAVRALQDTGHEILDMFYTGVSINRKGAGFADQFLGLPRQLLFSINKDFAARSLGGYSLMVLAK